MENWQGFFFLLRKRVNFTLVALLTFWLILLIGIRGNTILEIDIIQNAANQAAYYLVQQTKDDGRFEYRLNMNSAVKVKEKYNILRHAGTIYALGMYYQRHPDPQVRSTLEKVSQYLRDESIYPLPDQNNVLAVWSDPKVNHSGNPLQAKLGGTGLGLVALLSMEKIQPEFTPLSDLQRLGQFLVYMQKEEGNFYSKYIPSQGGRWDKWQSLYYPGEAALGLAMLYEQDGSEIWLNAAAKALAYLAHSREGQTNIPADHWAILATAKLLSLTNQKNLPVSRELLVNHAIQICETILQEQIKDPQHPNDDGGFSKQGKVTPTATRLEGLQAALTFLPASQEIRQRIESTIPDGLNFLLRAQIKDSKFLGAFPRAVDQIAADTPDAEKFNRRVTEVRIDYVQHALSAIIQYLELVEG
ncbi:MAG: hypothetical protein RLP02_21910 [Coleofasciculus sp. C2-GNP5-27]